MERNVNKTFLLMILSIISIYFISAQEMSNIRFEHLTVNDGLSENAVILIMQDSRGFIWIGTHDGLNKYDGYTFTIYKNIPENRDSLSDNTISAIWEDRNGMMWIGTIGGGLNRFNPSNETFARYQHHKKNPFSLGHNVINHIFEDSMGNLWITHALGVDLLKKNSNRFIHCFSGGGGEVFEPILGEIWMIDFRRSKIYYFDEELGIFKFFPSSTISQFEKKGSITLYYQRLSRNILLLSDQNVYKFRLHNERKLINTGTFISIPSEIKIKIASWVLESDSGEIFIATFGNGLVEINEDHQKISHFVHFSNDPGSLSNNIIYHVFEDRSGIIWISTEGGGVNLIKRDKLKFPHHKHIYGTKMGISGNYITAIYKDGNAELWVGTGGMGLNRIDEEKGLYRVYKHDEQRPATSLSHNYITSIHSGENPDYLWIGTGNGIDKFNIKKGTFVHYQHDQSKPGSLRDNRISSTFRDSQGDLWVISVISLSRLPAGQSEFVHYKNGPKVPESISDAPGNAIFEDKRGTIWIGSWGGGLNRYDRNQDSFSHYVHDPDNPTSLSHNRVWAIQEDSQGRMWIGTWGGGLNLFDRDKGKFKRYYERHGLANNVIYGILEDNIGNLWMSTNNGLSRFDPETETFWNYDVDDGLQSNEFNSRAFFKDSTGKMYFGGINGYNAFYPGIIKKNLHVPPVVITSVGISGQKRVWEKPFHLLGEMEFRHNDNFLSFEFAALDYNCPGKNRYSYILENLEKEWNFADAQHRFADYRNIPPGSYTLRVKGSNNDGVWNEEGVSLKIRILPPFWATWWFRLLGLGSFGFLFYFFVNFIKKHFHLIEFWKTKNIIGEYKVTGKIGSGGMGIVYKGISLKNPSKVVALKVLNEEHSLNDSQRRRFINEGAIIDSLDHPNIVKIHERISQGPNLFIAMEFLEGITLHEKMETEGILHFKETRIIIFQLVEVISVLHKKGIVHRDLKPENIMLIKGKGVHHLVKILDFGVARMQNLTRLTKSGMFIGTVGYTPPEQASGGEFGPPGDIYALGIIIYQMVTAEQPFFGETSLEIMKQILNEEPIDPQTFNANISPKLNALILKMLSKDPQKRPSATNLKKSIKNIF